jgi:DNA-binding CsgD family transcriptional regulator
MGAASVNEPEAVGSVDSGRWSWRGWRGREQEWGVVVGLLRAAEAGRGAALLIEGEPGIGKSRLLSEGADAAATAGFAVAQGAAAELRQLMPLMPLTSALGETAMRLAPNGPAVGDLRLVMVEQLRKRLEELGAQGPALITLDDLQWADPTTQLALGLLVPDLASYPLVWMLARTSGSGDPGLDRLYKELEQGGATRITLRALDEAAAVEVAADALEAVPGPDVLELVAGVRGSPFLLAELLELCKDEGMSEIAHGYARLVSAQAIHAITHRRLAGLPPQTHHLLQVAGIMGHSFLVDDLAEMLGEPVGELMPRLEEAVTAGVVIPAADTMVFRHDLLWQAVAQTVSGPVRRALHRQAGEMLLKRGGSAVAAAAHLMRGAQPGDRPALIGLDRAAREVIATSPRTAVDLATRALELTDPADPDRFARKVTAVDALTAAGRLREATGLAQDTLRHAPPTPYAAQMRYELTSILLLGGCPAEAVTEAEKLLSEQDLPEELRGVAELAVFRGLVALHDFRRGREWAEAVMADRVRHTDAALVGALIFLMHAAWAEGRVTVGFGHIREAVRIATGGSLEARRAHPRLHLARALSGLGQFEEAETVMQVAAEEIETLGHTAHAASPAIFRSLLRLSTGQLDDAAAEAEAGLNIADKLGTHKFDLLGIAVLAIVALRRGDIATAAQHIERHQSELATHGVMFGSTWSNWAVAMVGEAHGGAERAKEMLHAAYTDVQERRFLLMREVNAAACMTRVALATGDRPHAQDVVDSAQHLARDNPDFTALAAAAAHARGILEQDTKALAQAIADHADPWARASAAEDLGALLSARLGGPGRETAAHSLGQAFEGYQQIGALRDVARVGARLRKLGVRRRQWDYAQRPVSGWASLTPPEDKVALLVARGLTNRQVAAQMFLSPHTVHTHLSHIFNKLNIGSRVELTRIAVARHPEIASPDHDTRR